MVGLGEERNEVLQVMDDLRSADVDFLTIGQYLQPTRKHHRGHALRDARTNSRRYETVAYAKGFLMVSATPLTRSSHHAGEDFAQAAGGARGAIRLSSRRCRNSPASAGFTTARRRCSISSPTSSAIREFVPLCAIAQDPPAHAEARRYARSSIADMTVALQAGARDLHQPGDAGPAQPENHGGISRRAVQPSREPLDASNRDPRPTAMSDSSSPTNSGAACWLS